MKLVVNNTSDDYFKDLATLELVILNIITQELKLEPEVAAWYEDEDGNVCRYMVDYNGDLIPGYYHPDGYEFAFVHVVNEHQEELWAIYVCNFLYQDDYEEVNDEFFIFPDSKELKEIFGYYDSLVKKIISEGN